MQKSKVKDVNLWLSLLIFICIFIFVFNPTKYMQSVSNGLTVWAIAVIPALFPFFVLSKLLVELNFFERFAKYIAPITRKLFKAPAISGYIFIISIVSGYPIGAKLTEEYYKKGLLTATQCKKIATFTSTSGPLFILGTVGGKFLGNPSIGFILLFCHIASAIFCGIAFRNFYCDNTESLPLMQNKIEKNALNDCIYSSVMGILTVGAFICLFYMFIDMLFATNAVQHVATWLFPNNSATVQAFFTGLFEVTRGCQELSMLGLTNTATTVLCSTLISFGGFCIMLQSFTYLKNCKISFKQIFTVKLIQASIASLFTYLICLLIF